MEAFHSKIGIKETYLTRVLEHKKADEIIKGKYWEEGKGCAVGCTIHSNNHKAYEEELGIPEWLARVEDTIFEGLPNAEAKEFPLKFLESINVGAKLDKIKAPFIIYILEKSKSYIDVEKFKDVGQAIDIVINLWKKYPEGPSDNAARSARSAAWSARSAAWSAWSAARSAWSAARSAWSAARSAWSAAWSAAYVDYSEKLLELIRECK